jgi:hypothetical protein
VSKFLILQKSSVELVIRTGTITVSSRNKQIHADRQLSSHLVLPAFDLGRANRGSNPGGRRFYALSSPALGPTQPPIQ